MRFTKEYEEARFFFEYWQRRSVEILDQLKAANIRDLEQYSTHPYAVLLFAVIDRAGHWLIRVGATIQQSGQK